MKFIRLPLQMKVVNFLLSHFYLKSGRSFILILPLCLQVNFEVRWDSPKRNWSFCDDIIGLQKLLVSEVNPLKSEI